MTGATQQPLPAMPQPQGWIVRVFGPNDRIVAEHGPYEVRDVAERLAKRITAYYWYVAKVVEGA